jgi:hypothetical protein
VDLSLEIKGSGSLVIGMIGDAIERIPALRTYSEKNGASGLLLRLLPRLREEQYARLTSLHLLATATVFEDGFQSCQLADGRVFPLPNLKTLRIARYIRPLSTLPFLDCPSLTTLILTGWEGFSISFASMIDAIKRYPTLRHIISDIDFSDAERTPDWNVHAGVQHLALGGDEMLCHPKSVNLSDITSVFPNMSILTLKELYMVTLGVVRLSDLQELNILCETIYGQHSKDISSEIRLFLASIPNLHILRLGDSSRDTHILATVFKSASNKRISALKSRLFQILAEETPTECAGQQIIPAFCSNLQVVEVIRTRLDLQLLGALEKNVHLRGKVSLKDSRPHISKCLFKFKECPLGIWTPHNLTHLSDLTTSREEFQKIIQLSSSPCVSFE